MIWKRKRSSWMDLYLRPTAIISVNNLYQQRKERTKEEGLDRPSTGGQLERQPVQMDYFEMARIRWLMMLYLERSIRLVEGGFDSGAQIGYRRLQPLISAFCELRADRFSTGHHTLVTIFILLSHVPQFGERFQTFHR